MYNIRKYIKTGLFDYPPFLLIYFRSFSINSLFFFKIFPVFRSFLPISPLKMFFQLFGLLFLLFDQSLGQTLAKEPTSPDNPMPSNGSPTEEDLIQTLLKSPGLPPAMPPSLEEEPKVVEQPQSKGKTEEPSKEPKGPPPSTFAAVDSFHASQPGNSGVLPPSAPPTYIQCLHQIGARVCDPEGILNEKESTEIDETLRELEAATRKEKSASECERAGLELMVILVRHSALLDDPMNSVQSKLNNALGNWMRDPVHKCEKPVILMLSADAQMMNRRVWTGRHWDVPVNPSEMVQLFMEQDELTRKEKYGEVILNVIDGLLSRYEKRALQQNA